MRSFFARRPSAKTSATSAFNSSSAPAAGTSADPKLKKLNHARTKARTAARPPLGDDQFIQNFFYWAFLRYPNSTEQAYWDDILRTAYAQGQSAMLIANRELGKTVFESAEYAGRNRSNHDYVYDLYKTFLMRDPDQAGWDDWTAVVPSYGREHVRRGFDESAEFINLVSTLTPNGSPSTAVSSLVTARVDPFNQPGSGLAARDAEWGMPLLSLPGRAGLDLGLSLSYSSMVWTRSGPYLYFDEDNGSLSPGFRLGFPTIQEKFFDAQVGKNVYVLLTSGGRRTELRQAGSSNIYEAADSSYLQLIDNGSLLVRTTDGTQLSYGWFNHEFRCTEIKDRNGNYISVSYDWRGDITNITDTLGRVITFNYDANANPVSITQAWNGQTHTWATFGWSTLNMQLGFSGVSVVGTYSGETIPVLTQVGLDDGSYFTFQYTSAGQVNLIRRYRSDSAQASYTAYDYAATTSDCPRISQTRVWAENWTGVNGVPTEVATQYNEPGDGSHQMVAPDGTVFKEFYAGSAGILPAWGKGLVVQSEVWSGGVRQKWTTMAWTQDDVNVNYQTNPRVTETNTYDAEGNRKRVTISYYPASSFSLPSDVYEYAADGTTLLRRSHTDYELNPVYTDRRIIGLVFGQYGYDGSGALQSKSKHYYDWGAPWLVDQGAALRHDDVNYGAGFVVGRANQVLVERYDVQYPDDQTRVLTVKTGYNTAGSPVFIGDGLWHRTDISYTDSFSDSVNRNTFAYPTTVTDADGYSSYLQYNYDFGAKTRLQGPPPAGQSQGAIQTITYDTAARIQQVTTTNTGAYQRYVYGPNYMQSFSSVNSVADDAYAIQVFDGAGRSMGQVTNHPGSVGGYRMVGIIYDLMGRAVKQSNPTEINGSWVPSGDDASGVFYTQQTYDWKGRPLVTTNTDGTQKYASYSACGCAGGEVVTLTDEVGRQQKVYSEVLGRTAKTEVLNWDGSVYSTTANTFNARDQVTQVRQFQGSDTSSVYQDTTITFDGYGRLQTKHVPEQNAGTATVYAYNSDDTVSSVTDARGASATYTYNNRHLATGISYSAPAGITPTSNVSFAYDAVGNRTSMTDGTGTQSYAYDQLSRMTSETRVINGVTGSFTIGYSYSLSGELKSLTDPQGRTTNYDYDSVGRLANVTGAGYNNASQFANGFEYRAWGAPKHYNIGFDWWNGTSSLTPTDLSYNSRLQLTHFKLTHPTPEAAPIYESDYQYYLDGRPKFIADKRAWGSPPTENMHQFDRAYSYDHAGRMTQALTGDEARGGSTADGPYKETYQFDGWDHMTNRANRIWSRAVDSFETTYINNRNQMTGYTYDADGNPTGEGSFDAAGRKYSYGSWRLYNPIGSFNPNPTWNSSVATNTYDGDGQLTKQLETVGTDHWDTYFVRSTVLGGAVIFWKEVQTNSYYAPGWSNTIQLASIYAGGDKIAHSTDGNVVFEHAEPLTGRRGGVEVDPLRQEVGSYDPGPDSPGDVGQYPEPHEYGMAEDVSMGCTMDGITINCGTAMGFVNIGAAVIGPENTTRWNPNINNGRGSYGAWEFFHAFNNGYSGWMTSYGYSHWEGGRSFYNSAYDDYNENKSHLDQETASFAGQVSRHVRLPNVERPRNMNSSCGKFAQSLADRLYNTNVRDHPYGEPGNAENLTAVGHPMTVNAVDNVDQNGNPYRKGKTPIDGFSDELVDNGQDADVYHHILFVAGNVLDGQYGAAANKAFIFVDWQQAVRGRKESETELRDDYAGQRVGDAMLKTGRAGRSGNYAKLAQNIAHILCK